MRDLRWIHHVVKLTERTPEGTMVNYYKTFQEAADSIGTPLSTVYSAYRDGRLICGIFRVIILEPGNPEYYDAMQMMKEENE